MPTYPICEHFYSLQGEGTNAGKAAYFLRFSGCNVQCVFCDSKNSWNEKNAQNVSPSELVNWIKSTKAQNVVITGGEPLLHNLTPLCETLKAEIPTVQIWLETSGTADFTGIFDWVCLSPKKHYRPKAELYSIANELKIIIENVDDFYFAEEQANLVNSTCKLVLQAEWSKHDDLSKQLTNYILNHPKWQLSLQTHKYLNIQ